MNDILLNVYSGIKIYQFGIDSFFNNIVNVNILGYCFNDLEFKILFFLYLDVLNVKFVVVND